MQAKRSYFPQITTKLIFIYYHIPAFLNIYQSGLLKCTPLDSLKADYIRLKMLNSAIETIQYVLSY